MHEHGADVFVDRPADVDRALLVTARVSILWDDMKWYSGRIDRCDGRKHVVLFDDGTEATLALAQQKPQRPWLIETRSKEHLLLLMLESEIDLPNRKQIEQRKFDDLMELKRILPYCSSISPL